MLQYARPSLSWETRTGNQDISGRTFFVQNAAQSYSLQKAVTRGNRWRFEAQPGDYVLGQFDRVRSELQCSTKETNGVAVWYSDWVKYLTPGAVCGIGQFHQTEDVGDFSGYPPMIMEIEADDTLTVYTASVAAASQATAYGRTQRLSGLSFASNVWHRRVIQCVFGYSSDATLQLWIDGTQVLNLTGISMGMNDTVGPYLKFGAYGEQNNEQHIAAEYANIEIGTASLLSRVTDPIPVDA